MRGGFCGGCDGAQEYRKSERFDNDVECHSNLMHSMNNCVDTGGKSNQVARLYLFLLFDFFFYLWGRSCGLFNNFFFFISSCI